MDGLGCRKNSIVKIDTQRQRQISLSSSKLKRSSPTDNYLLMFAAIEERNRATVPAIELAGGIAVAWTKDIVEALAVVRAQTLQDISNRHWISS